MDVIFLIGSVQAVFLAVLIFGKKNKAIADYVLAFWMIFIGLHLLFEYFNSNELYLQFPHLAGVSFCFPILQGPFMFVYIAILIDERETFKKSYFGHAVLFLLSAIYLIFDFYSLSGPEKISYYNELSMSFPLPYKIIGFLNVCVGPAYIIWSLVLLRKHRKNIANQFSYSEQINLDWLKYIIAGLGFVWAIVLLTNIAEGYIKGIPYILGDSLIYVSTTVMVFFLGYFGFKQSIIFTDVSLESARIAIKKHTDQVPTKSQTIKVESYRQQAEKYKHSGLKPVDAETYIDRLLEYMKNEKPYLESKLSLKQLADQIDLTTNHLSQIINEILGKNFFDFINEYRVEEVKYCMADPNFRNFTLLAIAYECGFNSKSSFNNIFKKYTNLTPSEYLKTIAA